MPILISDYLDICDPVLTFDRFMEEMDRKIFETEHVDLQHLYIDGTKFEANANKYSWV